MAAIRIHTEQMNATDISHNYTGGVGLGTYLFYPIHDTDIEHEWYGDPDRSVDPEVDLQWYESAHFRSMWDEGKNPNPEDDIGARILATQLDKLETVYTYMNEKSGKHLPLVSNDENKRGDGRKYKWIVGNGWGGAWSGWSPFGLGFGIFYAGYDNPHEYVHGTDGHQMNNVTGHWYESHANFQVSWLGNPQANPVTNCPQHAHVYPSTGGNYYHAYLIWDHLVETPEFGGLYVTRLWNRGPNSGDGGRNYPPKGMEEMDPSPGTPFNEEWVKMAAKNITWDYDLHPEYASVWAGQEYKTRKHFTLLQEVPYLAAGWYEPPKWRTPQQHGYNICVLEPNQGTVTADITGHIDSARGSAWSAMFVAVDNGNPRYGNVFANGTQGSFTVQSGDDELYLVVVATPTNILEIGIFSGDGITDYRGAPKDRFPYQVQLGGTTPKATAWQPSAANNGTVDPTAYVSPNAYIDAGAQVLDNARVEDYAQVYGTVSGNAVVSGYAIIEANATVTDNALVSDYAIIRGGSSIYGNARVLEHAYINGVDIYAYAICKGNSIVSGPIHGNAMIDGNYIKNGEHSTGYQFLWAWGDYIQDGETYQDFGGLFLEYQFEQQNGYRVWDTNGATWARLINGASYASDNGGTVLDLDGVDQFVDLHSSVARSIDASFVVDVKWDGGANGQRIFEFSNPNGDVCWLSPSDSQGKLSFGINIGGDEQVVRAANPLPTGVWKTVSVMMFDDTAIVQVDDLDWGSNDAFTHDVKDVAASVCYLGRGASDGYFDGRMDNFTIWSRSLIDLVSPTPDPAEFFVEPVSVTETEVAMFSKAGADAGGNVEYSFEEALGGTGADDSGWQANRRYWDDGLDFVAPEYVYRVTMRDGSGNMTDSSAATRLTWQTTDKVYSQAADATGLAVIEAENYGRKAAGINGYEWEINTGAAGYLGTGAMMVSAGGISYGVDYDVQSPRMDYFIDFAKTGNHWVWVRAHGSSPSDDSYHLGDDMHASAWGNYQAWGTWNIYHWMKKGPFTVDSTGVHTINLWMREDGTRIDRLLVTSDDAYVPTAQTDGQGNVIGDGPAESASVIRTMLFKAALTDTMAPTPDPATFQALPAGVSGYVISMTATTGADASGAVEYYFEETSGAPGGTDSGWQSSATYSDSQLTPDTSYSYRVRMRDIYGNTTDWSGVESASTTNEVDDQAPTPNPAQFAVAPYPTFAQELTMTAVVGTDVNGPVEYYFTETSGGPGGSNSGWQSSPTYTDDGLSISTEYTYTVMMRDGLGNIGTASAPVAGTTSSDKLPLFSVDHDNLPGVGTTVETWDGFSRHNGNPTVVELGGEKWYSNDKATDDGMVSDLGQYAAGTNIPINGATIVTAVRPERYADGNWCLVVDIFYDQLCLGINNQSGAVTVKVSGASGANHTWTGGVIPEEPGVLSLTVANTANPAFEVFWRGADDPVAVSMGTGNGNTGGQPYTALYAQANDRGYAGYINIGRNNPDGWSTYNGLIGDTHVFDAQLSAAALLTVQDAVRAAMGIGGGVPDTDPPTPDPATFAIAPVAVSDTAISMTATTGADASGPVQYYFDEVSGNPGGTDSGWQTSTSYTDTGLTASTQYTYSVTMRDAVLNEGTASGDASATTDPTPPDTDPPTPNPATFAGAPAADSETAISMTATTGADASGPVQYYFAETSGNSGGDDSGWQTSASYTDTGLAASTQYTYTVQMRDALSNTGTASAGASATTDPAPDTDPPTPNPATFASPPSADSSSAISMTATTGADASGPVQYYFAETSGNSGGDDSGWQTSASYTDTGLAASTQYTYTVQMRDALSNTGTASAPANATTLTPDTDPPTPNPATFASPPSADSSSAISMTATTGSDASGPVEYLFTCTAGGGNSSLWQTSTSYTDSGLNPDTQYTYTVTMRDSLGNTGTASSGASATTDSPPQAGVIFSVDHNDLPAVGTTAAPWGDFNLQGGDPTVVELGGEKWMENLNATSDRLRHNSEGHGTTPIPIDGATIVTAIKPIRHTSGNPWTSIVDIFYDQLCIGVLNETGQIKVKISGANAANPVWTSTAALPEEPGVLTLTVGSGGDPAFEVFWRGENDSVAVSMGTGNGNTAGQPYTALYPSANSRDYAQYINLGGNNPDPWPSFNGLIGDTIVYDTQLSGAALLTVQDQIRAAMNIGGAPVGDPVPDVVGMTQANAEAAIVAAGFTVGTITTAYSDTVAAGDVISQNPTAGTPTAAGAPVAIEVSLGVEMVTVPNVVGQAQATAEANIVAAQLVVGTVTTAYSDTVAAGDVISQNPTGGASVVHDSAVDLVVSLGEQLYTVPNVVGSAQAAAEAAIVAASLTVGNVTTAYSDTVAAGDVISQNPVGGVDVSIGTPVDLVVSLGVQMVTVPSVVGLAQATAEANIVAAQLVVGTVTTASSATVPAGDVISQNPTGGASVVHDSAVDIVVSTGPASAGDLPWTEGFESASFTAGGWTATGAASVSTQAAYTGTYGAKIPGTSSSIETAIDTTGFSSIHVKYRRETNALDAGEYILVEWYDGSSWTTLETIEDCDFADGLQDKICGSGADNNASFKIRFSTSANKTNETSYVDDIQVTGTSATPDTDPPTPNPASFASAPAAISDTAISMTATTGSDASGPVEYYFDATDGGNDSGWQTSASYTDTGLTASTQYTYTVQMRDSASMPNVGNASGPASATTDDPLPPDTDPPTPDPAAFASPPSADSSSAISMTAATGSDASGPVQYLFTCTAGGGNSSSWQTSTSYTDSGLAAETQYTYTVTMRDALGNTTAASAPASATTDQQGATPAAPSGLSATAISQTQIDLSWTDNASDETGFKIERSVRDNTSFVQIATVGADVTSYSDTTVRKNTLYYYRVRATNGSGDSAYSNEASATTPK
ncbi:PASTA domain-containing protein [Candidatus Sumerlaeota bacterium]